MKYKQPSFFDIINKSDELNPDLSKLEALMSKEEIKSCGIEKLNQSEKEALKIWFFRLHNILSPKIAEIEKIKYDGKLIILDDGSKYESDDENISDGWFDGDKVLVIYDEMYKLDDLERVGVEEDND